MNAIIPYLKYLSILVLVLVLLFVTGKLLVSYFFPQINKQKPFFKLFVSLLAGFLFCTTVYAILKTHFITINLIVFLLFVFLLFEIYVIRKKPFDFSINKIKFDLPDFILIVVFLILVVLIYSYESFFVLQNKPFPFVTPFEDINLCNDIIVGLNRFGNENFFNKYIIYDEAYMGTSLYHFTDLWFSAFISRIFDIPEILAHIIVAYPLLIIIYVTGIISLFESFLKLRPYHYLLSILVLFCGGIYFSFYHSWPFLTANFIGDSFSLSFLGRKLLIVYIILIAFTHLAISKQYTIALIVLWCLIPLYPITLIGVLGGSVFLIIFLFVFNRRIKINTGVKINVLRMSVYFFILVISVFLFSFLTSSKVDVRSIHNSALLKTSFLSQLPLRTLIILFIETWVRLFVYYWPYIPLLVAFCYVKNKVYMKATFMFFFILLIVGGGLSSVLFSIINHTNMDYRQAFYNFFLPVLSVGLITTFIIVINNIQKTWIKLIFIIYFSALCIFQLNKTATFASLFKYNKAYGFYIKKAYSDNYILKLNELYKKKLNNCIGVQLSGTKEVLNASNEVFSPFLSFNKGFISSIDLSPFDNDFSINQVSLFAKESVKLHPFYRFIENSKAMGTFKNVDEEMLKFVQKYNFISYMIVAKDVVLYKPIEDMFNLEATDEISGERFYVRK